MKTKKCKKCKNTKGYTAFFKNVDICRLCRPIRPKNDSSYTLNTSLSDYIKQPDCPLRTENQFAIIGVNAGCNNKAYINIIVHNIFNNSILKKWLSVLDLIKKSDVEDSPELRISLSNKLSHLYKNKEIKKKKIGKLCYFKL